MDNDPLSPEEIGSMLKDLIGSQHGIVSMLAREECKSPQRMRYKINSLCTRIEKMDKEVHKMFFLLGQNVITQYREYDGIPRDEPEYLRDFMDPDTDPRAIGKFKYYVENFLRSRKGSGDYVKTPLRSHKKQEKQGDYDVNRFRESLKGRYMKLRKIGLGGLIDELEKLRQKAKMDLDPFYKLVSKFVERPNGKLYHFGWLFNAIGMSDQYKEFIERVKSELGL
jgi:hypothetical protein